MAVTPVYLSLSPATDKPDDLKRVVAAAGHPALVALTGDADGVGRMRRAGPCLGVQGISLCALASILLGTN